MARRERERYTERTRPHRKAAVPRGGQAPRPADGLNNPVVLVALGGLVVAIFLALGVLFGRMRNQTAAGTTPAAPTTESQATSSAITQSEVVTDAVPSGAGSPITTTDGLTATDGITATDSALFLPGEGSPYARPEDMQLDPATTAYFAVIETPKGTIRAELWPELAPAHVNSFVFLAREGFYDGLVFHRVEDWVVQGGDPTGTGGGGPGYRVPAEFNADDPVPQVYGTLAMARSADANSAGSQFYFVTDAAKASHLAGSYTNFGHVVEGMDVVGQLAKGDSMTSVTIEEKPIAERVVGPDDVRAGKLPESPAGGDN